MSTYNKKQHNFLSKGFTLVELMVSLTIFSVVMTISTGTLLVMIDINAKAQAINSATSNLTFALDSMTRDIRTGYHYHCYTTLNNNPPNLPLEETDTDDCSPGNTISFTRGKDGEQVGYRLNEDASAGTSQIEWRKKSGSWVPLTSSNVFVTDFELNVSGSTPGDDNQPKVDIFVKGYVNNGLDQDTDFTIQSHVVQRRLDII